MATTRFRRWLLLIVVPPFAALLAFLVPRIFDSSSPAQLVEVREAGRPVVLTTKSDAVARAEARVEFEVQAPDLLPDKDLELRFIDSSVGGTEGSTSLVLFVFEVESDGGEPVLSMSVAQSLEPDPSIPLAVFQPLDQLGLKDDVRWYPATTRSEEYYWFEHDGISNFWILAGDLPDQRATSRAIRAFLTR
jgi:hypothetical protein